MLILPATALSLTPTGLAWKSRVFTPRCLPDSSAHFTEYLLLCIFFLLRELAKRVSLIVLGHCSMIDRAFSHPLLPLASKSVSSAGQTQSPGSERWGNRVREERTCPDHHRLGNAIFPLIQCPCCSAITCQHDSRDVFKAFYSLCLRIPWTEEPCRL